MKYEAAGSDVHIVSLDADKAFDKIRREGPFIKLKDRSDPVILRLLVNYYKYSNITVKVNVSCLTYCDDFLLLWKTYTFERMRERKLTF